MNAVWHIPNWKIVQYGSRINDSHFVTRVDTLHENNSVYNKSTYKSHVLLIFQTKHSHFSHSCASREIKRKAGSKPPLPYLIQLHEVLAYIRTYTGPKLAKQRNERKARHAPCRRSSVLHRKPESNYIRISVEKRLVCMFHIFISPSVFFFFSFVTQSSWQKY